MQTDIYGAGPIEPVARINDIVQILQYQPPDRYYRVVFEEGLPRSPQLTPDFGPIAAATQLQSVPIPGVTPRTNELLHLRFEPLDDIECALWETQGQARFSISSTGQLRVTQYTGQRDPYWATTTFFVLGADLTFPVYMQIFNPSGYATLRSQVAFWGERYLLELIPDTTPGPQFAVRIPVVGRA